jgi:hypothetical protein
METDAVSPGEWLKFIEKPKFYARKPELEVKFQALSCQRQDARQA